MLKLGYTKQLLTLFILLTPIPILAIKWFRTTPRRRLYPYPRRPHKSLRPTTTYKVAHRNWLSQKVQAEATRLTNGTSRIIDGTPLHSATIYTAPKTSWGYSIFSIWFTLLTCNKVPFFKYQKQSNTGLKLQRGAYNKHKGQYEILLQRFNKNGKLEKENGKIRQPLNLNCSPKNCIRTIYHHYNHKKNVS
jgi:hypothetical protein